MGSIPMKMSLLKTLMTPRMLLIIWGAVGAIIVLYVMTAAGVQLSDRPRAAADAASSTRPLRDPRLITGEMADFAYAFTQRTAPAAVFNDDETGAPTRLTDFEGKAVVVNFWATWCAPCRVELPSLDALAARLEGEDVEVLLVAADPRGRNAAETMLADLGVRHATSLIDQKLQLVSAIGGPAALPITIIYDRNGVEVGRLVGEADWASPEAEALVRRAMAQGTSG
ncbi:MAG: redoxin family protein [Alphaproteobacteria bacterium]|nr:redoxin family protein [Alphaproteobacteria bacterium]